MPSAHESLSKVVRHRERLRAAGLRPVQFWVPDTRTAKFVAALRKQCQTLKGDAAETEILGFTEAAAKQIKAWK